MRVESVERPEISPLAVGSRFRHDITYLMTPPGEKDAPPQLPSGEYWIHQPDAAKWLEEGVFYIYSPLDSEKQAEVELSDEQVQFLEWILEHNLHHVRVVA